MNVYVRAALAFLVCLTAIAACLFLGAGRTDIPEFWVWLGLYAALGVTSFFLLDRDLLEEGMRPGGERISWRIIGASTVMVGQFLVAGIDRGHLHVGGAVPVPLLVAAFVATEGSWIVAGWATHVNAFFSSVARLQPDRGQHVIDTGPYRMLLTGLPGYADYAARVRWRLIPGVW